MGKIRSDRMQIDSIRDIAGVVAALREDQKRRLHSYEHVRSREAFTLEA